MPDASKLEQRSSTFSLLLYATVIGAAFASVGIGIVYSWNRQECSIEHAQPLHNSQSVEESELVEQLRNKYMSWNYNWDGMHDAAQAGRQQFVVVTADGTRLSFPQFGATLRHIFLVRHGQYNTQGVTDDERMLTPLGQEQAALTGMRLAAEGYPFSVIRHSTMRRAIETADIIRQYLSNTIPVTVDEQLSEGLPIIPEPNDYGITRNETVLGPDARRMESAFRKYFYRAPPSQQTDSYELIVCHANVIRFLVTRAIQIPPESWMRFNLRHGSITWITILPNGQVLLRMFSEAGHMPVANLSE